MKTEIRFALWLAALFGGLVAVVAAIAGLVAAEVKGVSRVEAEAATPCLETFLMGTGSDLTAPYGQVASNA